MAKITDSLIELTKLENLDKIKNAVLEIKNDISNLKADKYGVLKIEQNGATIHVNAQFINNEFAQILETKTIERTKYYIQRLVKSLTEIKTSKLNDINLRLWKQYDDILTDSLWIIDKRDKSGAHAASYWGNFVPQIPNQFLRRYTKKGEWVLDTFLGSGTTLIESKRLGRNGIGIEINPQVIDLATKNISKEKKQFDNRTEIINADCTVLSYEETLKKIGVKSVQFLIMHPPYWDIIKFSDNPNDISNEKSLEGFLSKMGNLIEQSYKVLDKGRYCALVIADKYSDGELIPLGFYTMQEFLKRGYKLKATIVKNFEDTKGKTNQKELWRYRALVGGLYIFKHEYIFLFKK
ncbi:DNA methyltransferase [Flavobacterium nackdongense]|uniref:Methyltransferase n=1 Tax=Flavobacterium nackdongense TaxID=2547394 RepID=A0A4P6Y5X6_9FLAO|nr:DNA methyltransferase [Flavobacterium nackdongense]QBN17621.1 DNA methyltransferase [Flavobacterium nackdongense]